jgi:hypothetical protein
MNVPKKSVYVWQGWRIKRFCGASIALFRQDPKLAWALNLEKEQALLEEEGPNDYHLKVAHENSGWQGQGLTRDERVNRIIEHQPLIRARTGLSEDDPTPWYKVRPRE